MAYDYDIDERQVNPPIWDDLSPEYKAACLRHEAMNDGKHREVTFDGVKTHIWTKGVHLKPGTYTEQFRGSAANITRCMNNFHKTLEKKYDNKGRIIDTSTAQLANGTCMYLTFELF